MCGGTFVFAWSAFRALENCHLPASVTNFVCELYGFRPDDRGQQQFAVGVRNYKVLSVVHFPLSVVDEKL
jgi:hypothetical protein